LVCIDTEIDEPTIENSSSTPAIIQIQVIFEVQHLPYRTSRLFQLIRLYC